jgi:hypothetical protein
MARANALLGSSNGEAAAIVSRDTSSPTIGAVSAASFVRSAVTVPTAAIRSVQAQ